MVKRYILGIYLSSLIFLLMNPLKPLAGNLESLNVVYLITDASNNQHIHWSQIESTTGHSVTAAGLIVATALPPAGRYMAYATRTGDIYVIDLVDNQQVSLSARLDVELSFPYDTDFDRSKSLKWSPDGRLLTFVGMSSVDARDVYIYDPARNELTLLTATLPTKRLAAPMWSPDGRQLAFLAAWEENHFEPVILALDNLSAYQRIAPGQPACRPYWSPNAEYVATNMTCYYSPQQLPETLDLPGLAIFNTMETGAVITLPINEPGRYGWGYGKPHWITDQQLVSLQGVNDLDATRLLSGVAVQYDLTANELEPIDTLSTVTQNVAGVDSQGEWELWYTANAPQGKYAYNPISEQFYDLSGLYDCVTVTISANGQYLGIPSGCDLYTSSTFRVYSLHVGQDVFQLEAQSSQSIASVGFIELES